MKYCRGGFDFCSNKITSYKDRNQPEKEVFNEVNTDCHGWQGGFVFLSNRVPYEESMNIENS
jgi:hypothetical protein